MAIPDGAYAVQYALWLAQDTGDSPVDTGAALEFPLSSGDQRAHEDAAAEAAAGAWKASMAEAYPGVTVHAQRVYLCRAQGDPWPVGG